VAVVARLKEQPGPDLEAGGAQLVPTLIRAGLVDEYRLFVQPILMGDGRPIFPVMSEAVRLKLVETQPFGSGVVYLRYQR
jgi:dihydrofolate reductase